MRNLNTLHNISKWCHFAFTESPTQKGGERVWFTTSTHTLDSILAGTDSNFTYGPDRVQSIKHKQSGLTADERQFLLDPAAAFNAYRSVYDMDGISIEVCPTQSRVALQSAKKGLGRLGRIGV